MAGKTYGYVRVSTKNQNEDRQMIAMRDYGVAEERIIVEKQSGKDFDSRPLYQRLLRRLRAGDTLVVMSIDRLGRNYAEILEQWRVLTKERRVYIVVLDMPLLNTQDCQEPVRQLITDLVLQVFSYVAQTERENIRVRQREGIEAAKARGVRFGRPLRTLPEGFGDVEALWRADQITAREAARRLGISRSTFFRRIRELHACGAMEKRRVPSSDRDGAQAETSADDPVLAPHVPAPEAAAASMSGSPPRKRRRQKRYRGSDTMEGTP